MTPASLLTAALLSSSPSALPPSPAAKPPAAQVSHDFDFFMGRWSVHNRYLAGRLEGSTTWVEFESTVEARPLLGGLGNEDVYRTEFWPGFSGMSFRFYDPATRRWAIYWADNRRGVLEPAVYGTFSAGGRAVFEGEDTLKGRPIRVRFTWSRTNTPSPRWEQAFSADGGKSWEVNWTMEFTRVDGAAAATAPGHR